MPDPTEKTDPASTTPTEAATAAKTPASKARATSRRLSDEQHDQFRAMRDDVDSVELKLTVPVDAHQTTIRGLPIDPVEAEPCQLFFFDTPKLDF